MPSPYMEMDDDELLKALMDQAEKSHRRFFAEGNKQLIPIFHVVTKDKNMVIATPWRDDDEKGVAIEAVRRLLKEKQALAYCFSTEAWIARYDPGEVDAKTEKWPKVRPEQNPNRIEIVTITAATRTKRAVRNLQMIRDPDGKLIDLKDMVMFGGKAPDHIGGLMPTLFDEMPS